MSVGQIVGGIVGGILTGGSPTGISIGMSIGAALDPVDGPSVEGPRLDDLSAQTASYGVGIGDIDGTVAVNGNVFWVENNAIKEVVTKEDTGGKGGGGGGESTTYTYFATFAVGLTDHQVDGLRRIWVGSDLVVDTGSTDAGTLIESDKIFPLAPLYNSGNIDTLNGALATAPTPGPEGEIRLYVGSDSQEPDPRMEADLGLGNCPAYRGMSYLVFYDWPLARYGNSLAGAQAKVELISNAADEVASNISHQQIPEDYGLFSGGYHHTYYISPTSSILYNTTTDGTRANHYTEIGLESAIPYISPLGGTVFSDSEVHADEFISPISWKPFTGVGDAFYGESGRCVWKNNTLYGYAWFSGNKIYKQLEFSTQQAALASKPSAMAVDNSGTVYVVRTNAVDLYDTDFNLIKTIDTTTLFSGLTTGGRATRAHFDDTTGLLWVGGSGDNVSKKYWGLDPANETATDQIDVPYIESSANIYAGDFSVTGQILTRFTGHVINESYSSLEHWKLPNISTSTKPLSDVVSERMLRSEIIEAGDIDATALVDTVRGFRTSGVQSIRSTLQPLMAAYQFDVIPYGYDIKCIPRGQSSVKAVDYDDMDARAYGSGPGTIIDQPREMDTQLPRKVVVKHLDDARDYDLNQQESPERQSSATVNIVELDVPLVFTPDEAAGIAEVIQYSRWLEREDFTFKLPATYTDLEPADVITVVTPAAILELRLTSINYLPDGRLECDAKLNDSAIYTTNAVGGTGATPTTTIPYASAPVLSLLDIPLIQDAYDSYGYVAAMCGTAAGWPSGMLTRSNDAGQTWSAIQGFGGAVVMGIGQAPLPEHDGYKTDRANTLTIDMYQSDMVLSSVTEAQMLTGLNWCAYGADERWEIMRFATATLNADGTYTLSTLIRGARGTEWATGLHTDSDLFVFISDNDAAFINADVNYLGVDRIYRGLTTGQDIDEVTDTNFTYNGVNLKPLSPVLLAGVLNATDWDLSWVRRSRLSTSWWSTGVERLIGEASESWEIDILDGSTVVRTLTAVTNAVTYTSADQTTDFGGNQSALTFRVYQISATVGRGFVAEVTV